MALFFSNNQILNKPAKGLLNTLMGLTLISIYFSKLPYLFVILSLYNEIEFTYIHKNYIEDNMGDLDNVILPFDSEDEGVYLFL